MFMTCKSVVFGSQGKTTTLVSQEKSMADHKADLWWIDKLNSHSQAKCDVWWALIMNPSHCVMCKVKSKVSLSPKGVWGMWH